MRVSAGYCRFCPVIVPGQRGGPNSSLIVVADADPSPDKYSGHGGQTRPQLRILHLVQN